MTLSNALSAPITIQTTHELKPQILRLSPITFHELWYILNELCTGEYAKLRSYFQHGLGNVVLWCVVRWIPSCPKLMVYMSHFLSSQCNVIVKYWSFAMADQMPHVNKTSLIAQACDIDTLYGFHHLICLILHWPHHTSLTDLWRILVSTVLVKACETWPLPEMQEPDSPMHITLWWISHTL